MSAYRFFPALLFFCACSGRSQTDQSPDSKKESWEIMSKVNITHIYSKNGLLDTSYFLSFIYFQKTQTDTSRSITIRSYDANNNLIVVKSFKVVNNSPEKLLKEITNEYDAKKNLIYIVSKTEEISTKNSKEYNEKNQEIRGIDISQVVEEYADSGETQQFRFDTTINTYEYDSDGNRTRWIVADTKGKTEKISVTTYSNKEKISGYELDANADTAITFSYLKDGDLIKEVAVKKKENRVDSSWFRGEKLVMIISHNEKLHFKFKVEKKYNAKGDEIESIAYK